jgi:hypothetical protein
VNKDENTAHWTLKAILSINIKRFDGIGWLIAGDIQFSVAQH